MYGEETSNTVDSTRYFPETQQWSEETAVTRTFRSTRAGSGPAAVRSGDGRARLRSRARPAA